MTEVPQHLRRQLDKAHAQIESMAASESTHEFEDCWKGYLSELRRVWNKTEATFKESPHGRDWLTKRHNEIKGDELLWYLWEARNTDEHTIQDIAKKKDGFLGFRAGPTGSALIREIKIEDGVLEIDADGSVEVSFRPANIHLLPVATRNGTVDVPKTHKGEAVNSDKIIELARLGAAYYEELVEGAVRNDEEA